MPWPPPRPETPSIRHSQCSPSNRKAPFIRSPRARKRPVNNEEGRINAFMLFSLCHQNRLLLPGLLVPGPPAGSWATAAGTGAPCSGSPGRELGYSSGYRSSLLWKQLDWKALRRTARCWQDGGDEERIEWCTFVLPCSGETDDTLSIVLTLRRQVVVVVQLVLFSERWGSLYTLHSLTFNGWALVPVGD